jgi:uncharacterized damage-inducible protein DinB
MIVDTSVNVNVDVNALESVKALTNALKFNDDVLDVSLTDMTDELARRQLRDGGPSIAWAIGHLLHFRNTIAVAVSCSEPAVDLARFGRSATDGQEYPAVRELQQAWADLSSRLVAVLARLTPEELAAPSPIRLPHGERTLLDALRFVVWHESLHLGQITMLRSHHGLTPTATIVVSRAAAAWTGR